ncbi:MAG: hypothetical protein ACPGZU_13865, partial [Ketobacter sp.]
AQEMSLAEQWAHLEIPADRSQKRPLIGGNVQVIDPGAQPRRDKFPIGRAGQINGQNTISALYKMAATARTEAVLRLKA